MLNLNRRLWSNNTTELQADLDYHKTCTLHRTLLKICRLCPCCWCDLIEIHLSSLWSYYTHASIGAMPPIMYQLCIKTRALTLSTKGCETFIHDNPNKPTVFLLDDLLQNVQSAEIYPNTGIVVGSVVLCRCYSAGRGGGYKAACLLCFTRVDSHPRPGT